MCEPRPSPAGCGIIRVRGAKKVVRIGVAGGVRRVGHSHHLQGVVGQGEGVPNKA